MTPRGRNYKRLNKKQKAKIDKTTKRMKRVREKDTVRLRKNIVDKLAWAKEQQKIALQANQTWTKNIQTNNKGLLKLEGIILTLSQILEEEKEK